MKQVTVSWLAANMDDGWRANAIREDLPRAFIKVGTLTDEWHQVLSVHDPLPSWVVGADGLFTVFLADDSFDSFALERDYPVWLDYSDVRPLDWTWVEAVAEATPDLVKAIESAAPAASDAPAAFAPSPVPDRWLGELPLSPTVCILHVYREEEGFVHDVYGVFASRAIARAHGNSIMGIPDAALAWELGDDGHEFAHVGKLRLALTNWVVSSERPQKESEAD